MIHRHYQTALIVGAGFGLSAALARTLAKEGIQIALAARRPDKLTTLAQEIGGSAFACDTTDRGQVERLFSEVENAIGAPEIVVYNAGYRARGPFREVNPADAEKALAICAYGAFLVAQQAVRCMLPKQRGAILFTGASASTKGYAQSAPFAMGKFALRGLAQSLAREFAPSGIHVAHFVIDGAIKSEQRSEPPDRPGSLLDPMAIAAAYLHVLHQPHSAWTWEMELRPWVEKF